MNKKILILNHHGIGDVLMNVPLIKTLHSQNFEIDMTFKSNLEQSLIEPMNIVKKSYLYDFRRKKFPNNIINLILFMNQLSKEKYDIGFSTCGTSVFYSKLLFKFLGIKKIIISEESAESNNHKSKINLHLLLIHQLRANWVPIKLASRTLLILFQLCGTLVFDAR